MGPEGKFNLEPFILFNSQWKQDLCFIESKYEAIATICC